MLIGYCRISTSDQNLDLQKDALEKFGCEDIYQDVASGAKTDRSGLNEAKKYLRKGDTLVVWKLDRLGRSLRDLINIVNELEQRNVSFVSLQENIDTRTNNGKLFFHIFGALAEYEREIIRERTKAGLSAARSRGRTGGRKPAMTEEQIEQAKAMMANKKLKVKSICATLGISKATLYKYAPANDSNASRKK
ncbi:MAG TPA: recombinase family protein [Pyrinomonadaceae bacterium]|jgi:DNA invertase Pin-like site-specific DNA recombinase|nr:recombinase family protein [Pyrinomonadaceae bacterium]